MPTGRAEGSSAKQMFGIDPEAVIGHNYREVLEWSSETLRLTSESERLCREGKIPPIYDGEIETPDGQVGVFEIAGSATCPPTNTISGKSGRARSATLSNRKRFGLGDVTRVSDRRMRGSSRVASPRGSAPEPDRREVHQRMSTPRTGADCGGAMRGHPGTRERAPLRARYPWRSAKPRPGNAWGTPWRRNCSKARRTTSRESGRTSLACVRRRTALCASPTDMPTSWARPRNVAPGLSANC